MSHINIQNLADRAGVSVATISRVLNGRGNFREETKSRIWKLANELNYMPSATAQNLRGSSTPTHTQTHIIMFIVQSKPFPHQEPIQERDAFRISSLGREYGFYVIPYFYCGYKGFQITCPPLLNGLIDGAIMGTPHPEIAKVVRSKVPLLLFDVPFSQETISSPIINIDYRSGFMAALLRLKELGHRRIAIVHSAAAHKEGVHAVNQEGPRLEAFHAAAAALGLEVVAQDSFFEDETELNHLEKMTEYARRIAPAIRRREVTALVGVHSFYTQTLKRLFEEMGLRVPNDVSLIGPHMDYSPLPGVSCIYMDRELILKAALDLLRSMIDGKTIFCQEQLVRPQLIDEGFTIGPAPAAS